MKKDTNKNFKGFTMMETVVCLAVFAVTLAAAVPAFEEFNEKTDEHRFKSECKSILATAEVYAGQDYKLGTKFKINDVEYKIEDYLINENSDLKNEFPDCKIVDVVIENGKVLSLEIERADNSKPPRTMYYTDEGDFSTEKPADFERIKERSLARLAEFTPYEAPADPKIIPERTKPAVTTAPETVAATEPTTTTVTTPKPVTTVTTTETTTTTTKATAVTTVPKTEAEKTIQTTIPKVTEPVVTTRDFSEFNNIDESDTGIMLLSNFMENEDVVPVNIEKAIGKKVEYNVKYPIADFGEEGKYLCGIGIDFAGDSENSALHCYMYDKNGNGVFWPEISDGGAASNYTEIEVNQGKLNSAPAYFEIHNDNSQATLKGIDGIYLYFRKDKAEVAPGAVMIPKNNDRYDTVLKSGMHISSVTIVFEDFCYGYEHSGSITYNYPISQYNSKYVSHDYKFTRDDGRVITVPVDSLDNATSFKVNANFSDPKIQAVYLNYTKD